MMARIVGFVDETAVVCGHRVSKNNSSRIWEVGRQIALPVPRGMLRAHSAAAAAVDFAVQQTRRHSTTFVVTTRAHSGSYLGGGVLRDSRGK